MSADENRSRACRCFVLRRARSMRRPRRSGAFCSTRGPPEARARMLGPAVEILLAAGDLENARAGAAELSEIASAFDASLLSAASAHATGAVLLAEGDGVLVAHDRRFPLARPGEVHQVLRGRGSRAVRRRGLLCCRSRYSAARVGRFAPTDSVCDMVRVYCRSRRSSPSSVNDDGDVPLAIVPIGAYPTLRQVSLPRAGSTRLP
jgi:hypothetical protein